MEHNTEPEDQRLDERYFTHTNDHISGCLFHQGI